MNENNVKNWYDCYGEGWTNDIISPESFSHPAKYSRALIRRIYEYAIEQGYLEPGSWVVDPFGGVGLGAFDAVRLGINWVGCELEQNFVDLAAGCDCEGFTAVQWQRMFGRGERFRHNERANMSVCPRCANQLNQRPSRPEIPLKNGRAARRVRMQAITKERKRKPQYTEPMPLPGTKLATQATKKQLSLFALSVVEPGVYEQNSGRIPCKHPHRYQGNLERWLSGVGVERTAVILQGDSRKLAETVRGWAEGAISSPPYSGKAQEGNTKERDERRLLAMGREDLVKRLRTEFRDGRYYGGDPGQLGNLPEGEFTACLSSPPYADSVNATGNGIDWERAGRLDRTRPSAKRINPMTSGDMKYGEAEGQLGAMKDAGYDAAISSPPFGAGETRDRHSVQAGEVAGAMNRAYTQDRQGQDEGNLARLDDGKGFSAAISSPPYSESHVTGYTTNRIGNNESSPWKQTGGDNYGITNGQLASLPEGQLDGCLSSPPYADAVSKGDGPGVRFDTVHHSGNTAQHNSSAAEYGRTPGNLGNLDGGQFDSAVSSPPFMDNNVNIGAVGNTPGMRQQIHDSQKRDDSYGITSGQLGCESPETFWSAAKTIVEQTYEVLKPGGIAIWVVKDFVRDGQRVDFSGQWEQLCVAVGFQPIERVRAWLIENRETQYDIFGGKKTKTVERKSFFRRLAEKNGSPRIDWEDVLILQKPEI